MYNKRRCGKFSVSG